MFEWIKTSPATMPAASPLPLAWRIGVALALGVGVAGLSRWARRGEASPTSFTATLILLAVLIATATQVIGDNVARAFSLLGALSVVRFRTAVKDTLDTAFVMAAVVVGMAAGADQWHVGLIGLAVAGAASMALWPPGMDQGWPRGDVALALRVGLSESFRQSVESALEAAATRHELIAIGTARQGSALDLKYRLRIRPGLCPASLVAALNSLEGVEGADLSRFD